MSKDLPRLPNPIAASELFEKPIDVATGSTPLQKRELYDLLNSIADEQSPLLRQWVAEECMLEKMVWTKCVTNKFFAFQCNSELEEHDICIKDRTLHMANKRNRWMAAQMDRLLPKDK